VLLLHEMMDSEADAAADAVRQAFGFKVTSREAAVSSVLPAIKTFDGRYGRPVFLCTLPGSPGPGSLGLTRADLFFGDEPKSDDWVFGVTSGQFALVSTAHLATTKEPGEALLFGRIALMTVHEIGHAVVTGPHLKPTEWVDAVTGSRMPLAEHCSDRRCAMWEVADLVTPPLEEGYIELAGVIQTDTGLDDLIARRYDDWFCLDCRASIVAGRHWTE